MSTEEVEITEKQKVGIVDVKLAELKRLFDIVNKMLISSFDNGKIQFDSAAVLMEFKGRYTKIIDKELDKEKIEKDGYIYEKRDVSIVNKNIINMDLLELYAIAKSFIRQSHKNGFINIKSAVDILRIERNIENILFGKRK